MRKSVLFVAEFTLIFAASLTAQDGTGRIVGTVLDPTGATIADARITVTNTAMFLSRQIASDCDGRYQILDLPIGTYSLQAEKAGFTKLVMSDHDLLIGQTLRIDLSMTIGTITEVVQVSDEPRDVETMSSTLG